MGEEGEGGLGEVIDGEVTALGVGCVKTRIVLVFGNAEFRELYTYLHILMPNRVMC